MKTGSKADPGWAVVLQPYLKSTQIFQCDKEPNRPNPDPTQPGYTDYWFNGRMAGVPEARLEHQALTIINSDGESSDASYNLRSVPPSWRTDTGSPLYRHLEGAHFAFADGHAKWLRGNRWKNGVDMNTGIGPTFRIQPVGIKASK
jgi:prepilin-type processing-associated H-X9-DG protein